MDIKNNQDLECSYVFSSGMQVNNDRSFYFLHIPKTAGTAFSLHLKNQFNHQDICPAGYLPELMDIPRNRRSSYKLITGHFHDAVRNYIDNDPYCLTVLRDPIERVLSLLFYQKHLAGGDPLTFSHQSINELANSFRTEVLQGLESILGSSNRLIQEQISNYQVRVFLGEELDSDHAMTSVHLESAKKKLLTYQFIGLTERMQDSLDLLAYTFGWCPVKNIVVNETPSSLRKQNVSSELIKKIAELNRYDIELYEFAKDIFSKRFEKMINNLNAKFKSLSSRRDESFLTHVSDALEQQYVESFAGRLTRAQLSKLLDIGPVGQGWYEWEEYSGGGHRWTGPGTDSFLDLPVQKIGELTISFRIAGYASNNILSSAAISADGTYLETEVVHDSGGLYLRAGVSSKSLNQELPFLRVGIHLKSTLTGKEINPASPNNRRMGLAVHSVNVRPVK